MYCVNCLLTTKSNPAFPPPKDVLTEMQPLLVMPHLQQWSFVKWTPVTGGRWPFRHHCHRHSKPNLNELIMSSIYPTDVFQRRCSIAGLDKLLDQRVKIDSNILQRVWSSIKIMCFYDLMGELIWYVQNVFYCLLEYFGIFWNSRTIFETQLALILET